MKEEILEIIKNHCETAHRNVGEGCNYKKYILPKDFDLIAEKIVLKLSSNMPVSGMLSPIAPTEIRIMEKAREEYGTSPYTDEEEVAFAKGARWMKKMLLGDNYR